MNIITKIAEIHNVSSTSNRHMTPRRERCAVIAQGKTSVVKFYIKCLY
jgi:hypothetical protein